MNVRSQFKYYIYTNRSYLDSRQLCILNRLYSSRKKRMWILQLNCWCGSISGQHSFTHFEYSGQFILYIFFIVVNWFPFGIGWNDDSHETNDATRFFFSDTKSQQLMKFKKFQLWYFFRERKRWNFTYILNRLYHAKITKEIQLSLEKSRMIAAVRFP